MLVSRPGREHVRRGVGEVRSNCSTPQNVVRNVPWLRHGTTG
jgi:hypothetical protein